jgi:hypothetical protein
MGIPMKNSFEKKTTNVNSRIGQATKKSIARWHDPLKFNIQRLDCQCKQISQFLWANLFRLTPIAYRAAVPIRTVDGDIVSLWAIIKWRPQGDSGKSPR